MDKLISLQAAIDAGLRLCGRDTKAELINLCEASIADSEGWAGGILDYMGELEDLPSAQPDHHEENLLAYAHDMGVTIEQAKRELQMASASPDLSDYSDKLWRKAYERGKAERNDRIWEALSKVYNMDGVPDEAKSIIGDVMLGLDEPSAQPEKLTDKEQRIFLSAMGREEEVCKEVDDAWRDCREPYEDSLVHVCKEIRRKVKDALWT